MLVSSEKNISLRTSHEGGHHSQINYVVCSKMGSETQKSIKKLAVCGVKQIVTYVLRIFQGVLYK